MGCVASVDYGVASVCYPGSGDNVVCCGGEAEEMIAGWQTEIDAAQKQTHYRGAERITFSEGDVGFDGEMLCHDCKVAPGQFHVFGCDAERCGRCNRQAIACGCWDEEDDEVYK